MEQTSEITMCQSYFWVFKKDGEPRTISFVPFKVVSIRFDLDPLICMEYDESPFWKLINSSNSSIEWTKDREEIKNTTINKNTSFLFIDAINNDIIALHGKKKPNKGKKN